MKISNRKLQRMIREEYTRLKRQGLIKEDFGPSDGSPSYEIAAEMVNNYFSPATIDWIITLDKGIELLSDFHQRRCPDECSEEIMDALEEMEMHGVDEKTAAQALVNAVQEFY